MPDLLAKHANFCLNNIQPSQNVIDTVEKCVQGSFSHSNSKFGETAVIQCGCNALLAVS